MKRRWGFWNNYLSGITWERWRALRAGNTVDPGFRHRAAYLTLASVRNSVLARREERQFGTEIQRTRVEAPLFLLGHWRSGTTHLHNLLACDAEQLAAPNSIQVTYPHTFLLTEADIARRFSKYLPPTRPMDNVSLTAETPQEDEFALCTRTLLSPMLGMATFPRRADHYDRYLSFREAMPAEAEEWKRALVWFLKKATLKLGRPLVLKSPPHTARVRLLLELFPDARFVHICRNPYAVFQSTRHLLDTLAPLHTLQRPPFNTDQEILRRYNRMYDSYFEDRSFIPEGQLHELRYEEVARDPVTQLAALYERLRLPGFAAMRPQLQAYVDSISGYRQNRHRELPLPLHAQVAQAWQRGFEAWEYPK